MSINAKSIMGVMMLAAECGSVVRLKAEGGDAEAAIEALATLIAAGFGES
jgi:phosphocarrier protein HPr